MSGLGAPGVSAGDAGGHAVAVVAGTWHQEITDGLLAGAERVLTGSGARMDVYRVPGSFELPLAAAVAARAGYDGVVALGVVIRGGTPHFEYVCRAATDGLTRVSLDTGVPVGFGILTCDDEDQARQRAGLEGSSEDKGAEAAAAVLAMIALLPTVRRPPLVRSTGFGLETGS
jgi:6,7-dimethyl-8-ribityllumazine synthase